MSSTFVKAAELWLPNTDYSLLEFGTGAFGPAKRFLGLTRGMCFGRGEGLPGRTWENGLPELLPQFEHRSFFRTDAARAAGFSCAVAVPFFKGDTCHSILVLFCGHDVTGTSALELWHQATPGAALTLQAGAYGEGATDFETASRQAQFASGEGLPGAAWQHCEATFMPELGGAGSGFLRAEAAGAAGLQRGLAIPLETAGATRQVLSLLASPALPLAQRIERWVPDARGSGLRRAMAFSELHGGASTEEASLPLAMNGETNGEASASAIVRAWTSGMPVVSDSPSSELGAPAAAASAIGAHSLIAIPVMASGAVKEILALYL